MFGTFIQSVTVTGATAASISFTSIPSTYTDLVILLSARSNYASGFDVLTMTGNSTASSTVGMTGNTTPTGSSNAAGTGNRVAYMLGSTQTASNFGNTLITIPNYARAGWTKQIFSQDVAENAASTTSWLEFFAGSIGDTNALTSITLTPLNGQFVQYTTAYLYGLTSGSGAASVTSA